jgi:serine/threonine-protein kinase
VLGGYGAWLHWLHPAGERGTATPSTTRAAATASARVKAPPKPAADPDTEPFAEVVREAQAMFEKDPKGAVEKLKAAYALGSPAPVRSLLSHASVAVDDATPRGCRVAAIARPRPYQLDQAASQPALARTSEGVLLGWVDNHADARRRQGHVVLLDDALRRKGDALAVTPEATTVQDLGMLATGDKVVVAFHDDSSKQPGVYVRQLGADGRIASPLHRVSHSKPSDGSLSFVATGDGGYLAVWAEELAPGTTDLVVQRLGATLEPAGDAQRLTAFPPIKGVQERVSMPDAAVSHGELAVAFSFLFPGQHAQVLLLNVPLADLERGKTLEIAPRPGKKGAQQGDMVLGTLRAVAKTVGRVPQPRVACEKDGCLVGWDEEKGGANVAFLERGKSQPLWHRDFADKGARPAVIGDDSGLATAWYEDARLKLAPLGRDGVGLPSVVNRVSGLQPHPALARGSKAGEWLLAWRDFEAGHFELFALKAECP